MTDWSLAIALPMRGASLNVAENTGDCRRIPHPKFFLAIAQNRAPDQSKIDQWLEDYKAGFLKGYGSRKEIPDTSGLRPLEWPNLSVGTKIYNSSAQHEVTITSVSRGQGLIYVRYLNGTEEPKDFNAIRSFWFTKH